MAGFETEQRGETVIVRFTGPSVIEPGVAEPPQNAGALGRLLQEHDARRYVLNLSAINYVNSTAVGMLVAFNKLAREQGATAHFCCLQPPVAEVFGILKLEVLLDLHPDEASALGEG